MNGSPIITSADIGQDINDVYKELPAKPSNRNIAIKAIYATAMTGLYAGLGALTGLIFTSVGPLGGALILGSYSVGTIFAGNYSQSKVAIIAGGLAIANLVAFTALPALGISLSIITPSLFILFNIVLIAVLVFCYFLISVLCEIGK